MPKYHEIPLERPMKSPADIPPGYLLSLQNETAFPSDLSQRGGPEERAFVRSISGNILDRTGPLAFADWLDEHGRTDEASILRDPRASPVICPFRVLPYSRHAPLFKKLLDADPAKPDEVLLAKRVWMHHYHHGSGFLVPAGVGFTRLLMLDDEEAVLAGLDRWPLLPGEPEPIVKVGHLSEIA